MQNYCKTIGALAAASALVAGNAQAGTVDYELHTGYSSEYIYRGVMLGQDLIEVGADVKTEYNGFVMSAGAWYGTTSGDNVLGFNLPTDINLGELDLYGEVGYDFGWVTTSVGYIYRHYDLGAIGNSANSQEVSFGLSHDFGFVDASLTYYWDVDTLEINDNEIGTTEGYTELALNRSFVLTPCLNLNLGTNVGYLVEGGEWTAWTSKVALDWGFAEHAKLSPFVALSVGLGDQEDTLWYSTTNHLVGGCMLSVNF